MPGEIPARYSWRILTLLALINFVNYVDRQIIFPLADLIKRDFQLSDLQVGLLGTVFSIVHSLCTVPFAVLADRVSRKKVITFGVLFWSGATFLSGIAASYRWLLAARALVGVGEAAYTPAGTATITAVFPRHVRARVQGIFDLGMFAGGALGLALGGILGQWVGWRPAFFIVGVPGLLLALTVFRLPEPPRPAPESVAERIPIRDLLAVPAYLALLASGLLITFAGHSYIAWGTIFATRYKSFGLGEASVSLAIIVVTAGLCGVMAGAALADWLARRYAWGRMLAVVLGFSISAPFIFWALHAQAKSVFLGALFVGTFFMTWYHGPVTATIHDLVPARAHATAQGVYYFTVNFFATTLAYSSIGAIADRAGLLAGMKAALAAQVCGALSFLLVIYFIRRDGLRHPRLARFHQD